MDKEQMSSEETAYRRPFFLEQVARWLCQVFPSIRVPFLSGILTGLLAHGFAFANKLPGYDEVGSLFNKGTTVSSGRWGLELLRWIFPDASMPWIYGILSVVLLSVAACIIVEIFRIRSPVLQALVAGSILAFPSLTATVIYLYTLSSYAVSFLLAVLSVWLLQKKTWRTALAAGVCLILSLSIYQAYLSIIAGMLVLLLIQDLLKEVTFRQVMQKGVWFLAFLILSLLAYLAANRLVIAAYGDALNSYASQRISFSLSYLPTGIYEAYRAFYNILFRGLWGLIPLAFSRVVHGLCLGAVVVLIAVWLLQKRRPILETVLLLVLLVLLPLAINCIYLFVSADPALCAIHTLVLYGFILVYVFAAVVADACDIPALFAGLKGLFSHCAQNVLVLGLLVSIVCNVYVANGLYLNLHLRYENAYGFYTSLLANIRQHPEYGPDTTFALFGEYEEADFYWEEFDYLYQIMGSDGFQPDSHSNFYFLHYYLGVNMPYASGQQRQAIAASEEFARMPSYPYHGFVDVIDGVMVVKLSD